MTPDSLRVKQWREANRQRYNETQKRLMAEKRRKLKEQKNDANNPATPLPA